MELGLGQGVVQPAIVVAQPGVVRQARVLPMVDFTTATSYTYDNKIYNIIVKVPTNLAVDLIKPLNYHDSIIARFASKVTEFHGRYFTQNANNAIFLSSIKDCNRPNFDPRTNGADAKLYHTIVQMICSGIPGVYYYLINKYIPKDLTAAGGVDISLYTVLGGSGSKFFRTLSFPKFLLARPKRYVDPSPVMVLMNIANFAWRKMFTGRPPPKLIPGFIALSKKLAGVPLGVSMSSADVKRAIAGLISIFPKLMGLYCFYLSTNADEKNRIGKLKYEHKLNVESVKRRMQSLDNVELANFLNLTINTLEDLAAPPAPFNTPARVKGFFDAILATKNQNAVSKILPSSEKNILNIEDYVSNKINANEDINVKLANYLTTAEGAVAHVPPVVPASVLAKRAAYEQALANITQERAAMAGDLTAEQTSVPSEFQAKPKLF